MLVKHSKGWIFKILGSITVIHSLINIFIILTVPEIAIGFNIIRDTVLLVLGANLIRFFRTNQLYVDENYVNILRAVPKAKVIAIKDIEEVKIKESVLFLKKKNEEIERIVLLSVSEEEKDELNTYIKSQIEKLSIS